VLNRLDTNAIDGPLNKLLFINRGCWLIRLDSRNRQVVTSIAKPEAGTACIEDVVALACRGRNGKEVRDTYLCVP